MVISAVEYFLDMEEVTSSNLVPSTKLIVDFSEGKLYNYLIFPKVRNTKYIRTGGIMEKEYHKQKSKEHYQKYKDKYNARNQLQKQRTRSIINEAKSCGCRVCEEKEIACLDFHHLSDKDVVIATMLGWSDKRVKEEISKCVVLCANCHRKHHAGVIDIGL